MEMTKIKKQKMVIVIVLMFVLTILIAVIVNRIDRLEIKIQNEVGEEKTVKVMSWNIDDGHPPTEADQIARMARLAEIIANEKAEIVLLQEFYRILM